MASSFWCDRCALALDDGVDYQSCPRCGGDVQVSELPLQPASQLPSVAVMTRVTLYAAIAVQTVLAALWPHDFPYLRVVLFVAQLAAVPIAVSVVAMVPAIRILLSSKIRVLHGLEHATIAVLAERGITVDNGLARTRSFEIVLDRPNGWNLTTDDVRNATGEAITRIARGEHALVYSPRCGTSWLVGRLLAAIAIAVVGALALGLHVATGHTFAGTVVLLAIASRAARPLGLVAQRLLTVSPHFASARVIAVERVDGQWIRFDVAVEVAIAPSVIAEPL